MGELAVLFLKLGSIAFGGPAAHIAMMEEEVVRRRGWMTHEGFLDLLGATNLIPGPNSTEMAIHIGYVRGGWKGLVIAGVCFIVPAVLITLLCAYLYKTYGAIPEVGPFILGIRSAVIGIVLAAIFRLGKPVLKNRFMVIVGILVTILSLLGIDEILLLLAAGAAGLLWSYRDRLQPSVLALFGLGSLLTAPAIVSITAVASALSTPSLTGLGLFFLKIGSILYGSGYVLVAFLQDGLVNTRHWLTQSQLLDAIAIGQCTPGPVLSTATFVGYLVLGLPGATVATIGIFLPSFFFVLLSTPFIPRLRRSPHASGFLDGVNAAALGLMLAVTILLAGSALGTAGAWIIFLLASGVLIRWNFNAAWIVAGGACIGWLFSLLSV